MELKTRTAKFGLDPAPRGLRLVQDFVNTSLYAHCDTPDDVLHDTAGATEWLGSALARWADATGRPAPALTLQQPDLAVARGLREQLRHALRASAAHVDSATASLGASATGTPAESTGADIRLTIARDLGVGVQPVGSGAQGLAALIALELLLAEGTDGAVRLKTCAAIRCGACFYDGSPNRSRSWHNTKLCGNVPNLRASRARRKSRGKDANAGPIG